MRKKASFLCGLQYSGNGLNSTLPVHPLPAGSRTSKQKLEKSWSIYTCIIAWVIAFIAYSLPISMSISILYIAIIRYCIDTNIKLNSSIDTVSLQSRILLSIRYWGCIDSVSLAYHTVSVLYGYCIHNVSRLYRYCIETTSILYRHWIDTVAILM